VTVCKKTGRLEDECLIRADPWPREERETLEPGKGLRRWSVRRKGRRGTLKAEKKKGQGRISVHAQERNSTQNVFEKKKGGKRS